jgi:hypothetical protein
MNKVHCDFCDEVIEPVKDGEGGIQMFGELLPGAPRGSSVSHLVVTVIDTIGPGHFQHVCGQCIARMASDPALVTCKKQ